MDLGCYDTATCEKRKMGRGGPIEYKQRDIQQNKQQAHRVGYGTGKTWNLTNSLYASTYHSQFTCKWIVDHQPYQLAILPWTDRGGRGATPFSLYQTVPSRGTSCLYPEARGLWGMLPALYSIPGGFIPPRTRIIV